MLGSDVDERAIEAAFQRERKSYLKSGAPLARRFARQVAQDYSTTTCDAGSASTLSHTARATLRT